MASTTGALANLWSSMDCRDNIIVGVLDSGIDTASVTLKQMLWTNKKEKADGKDNDKNGYVDDSLIVHHHPRSYFLTNSGIFTGN